LIICARINERINAAAIENLASLFRIFRVRFTTDITLGMSGGGALGPKILEQWLADSLVDQIVCSGHEGLVLNDLVDAAIRSNALTAVFVDADELLRSPARVMKFIVQHLGAVTESTLSADATLWQAGQQQLRAIPKRRYPDNWSDGLRYVQMMCGSDVVTGGASIEPVAVSKQEIAPHHLFVTETGLGRLGGWDKLKTRPIRFGGVPVSAFDNVSLLSLTNSQLRDDQFGSWHKIPGINRAGNNEERVVFDIWPAPYSLTTDESQSGGTWVDVPRQILVGRRCPVPLGFGAPSFDGHEAVYIMSNFNKARYLHAALYGWLMQSHPRIRLEIVDDISTDSSVAQINDFRRLMEIDSSIVNLSVNEAKRGTYWIRNLIISRNQRENVVFFINDSDDISSALRTTLQIGTLMSMDGSYACLFNIVRVNNKYAPLPLNDEVERYGTASLCFKSSLINKVGFFQNIRKNADTEFIRRVRRFFGKSALPWIQLPVMFQPFDGENLTADIYSHARGGVGLAADNNLRGVHIEIAERHHQRLNRENLPTHFGFPLSTLPADYAELGGDFLIDGYRSPDSLIVVLENQDAEKEKELLRAGLAVMTQPAKNRWILKTVDESKFESSAWFMDCLREYSIKNSLHAYVISADLVHELSQGADYQVAFLGKGFAELVLSSKAKGDRFVMRSDGSWHDVGIYLNPKTYDARDRMNEKSQAGFLRAPSQEIPALLHTSGLVH
jgi:hypothetical protein